MAVFVEVNQEAAKLVVFMVKVVNVVRVNPTKVVTMEAAKRVNKEAARVATTVVNMEAARVVTIVVVLHAPIEVV